MVSFEHAQRVAQVPGVVVPDAVLQRFSAMKSLDDQARVGREMAVEQIRRIVREGWAGVYLMSTASPNATLEILRAALQS
jgi:5,10-methylenetetrahydrofolate reductase